MSGPAAVVCIDLHGVAKPVGQLWVSTTRESQRAAFEYFPSWIADPIHWALGPALPVGTGTFHTAEGRTMFDALGDSAPDRWGRRLIARAERNRARKTGSTPRALREIDFLLGVSDVTRQGALRFASPEGGEAGKGEFLAPGTHVPPLIDIGKLLSAAEDLASGDDSAATDDALAILLAPGSSLGGTRAKASIRDRDGTLSIAKFPQPSDDVDVVRWEVVMLRLAERSGIRVPGARVELAGDRPVLVETRFDRHGQTRLPFLSALSLLDARDGDRRSYVELAEAIRQISIQPAEDVAQLWRRMAFNILASNFDDHLRNHAVLFDNGGWTLSPAYDLNPVPRDVKGPLLSTSIHVDDDPTASIELAVGAAADFSLRIDRARSIAGDVARAVAAWETVGREVGLRQGELERMRSAFEHGELRRALRW